MEYYIYRKYIFSTGAHFPLQTWAVLQGTFLHTSLSTLLFSKPRFSSLWTQRRSAQPVVLPYMQSLGSVSPRVASLLQALTGAVAQGDPTAPLALGTSDFRSWPLTWERLVAVGSVPWDMLGTSEPSSYCSFHILLTNTDLHTLSFLVTKWFQVPGQDWNASKRVRGLSEWRLC